MPLHTVERDISEGRLVQLSIEDITSGGLIMPMSAVYPTSAPPGPAGDRTAEALPQPDTGRAVGIVFHAAGGCER